MNILKIIAIAIAMLISANAHSERIVLTQDDVCKMFLSDAVDISVVYVANQSREEAAQWVIDRAQKEPLHYVFFPGDLKIIDSMDEVKIEEPDIVDFAVAVYNVCMKEIHHNPDKWLQEIPGAGIIRQNESVPSLFEEESPKVMM